MAYTALYRKFRPLTFSEMVGQEHITKTLKNQIISGRVGHAYLFSGGRGTGKTSSAKILARAINCLNPKDGEPCNECEICKGILSGSLTDVVEMDAASNNSVEDIRQIREEVNFLPTLAKYRIYIIDEVHMLSVGAFNALLKTLEEPPEHVKFILATTEPQKLPATILSRCQRFDFKRIQNSDVIKRLKIICSQSNIEITDEALNIIATLSEGAMRDAISILERCVQDGENQISENKIKELVGIPKMTYIHNITKAVLEYNVEAALENIDIILNDGKDLNYFLWEIIKYIKDLILLKTGSKVALYNKQEKEQMQELVSLASKERLLKLVYAFSDLEAQIKWSSQKTIVFQVGIMKACSKEENQGIEELEKRLSALEETIAKGTYQTQPTVGVALSATQKTEASTQTPNTTPAGINAKNTEQQTTATATPVGAAYHAAQTTSTGEPKTQTAAARCIRPILGRHNKRAKRPRQNNVIHQPNEQPSKTNKRPSSRNRIPKRLNIIWKNRTRKTRKQTRTRKNGKHTSWAKYANTLPRASKKRSTSTKGRGKPNWKPKSGTRHSNQYNRRIKEDFNNGKKRRIPRRNGRIWRNEHGATYETSQKNARRNGKITRRIRGKRIWSLSRRRSSNSKSNRLKTNKRNKNTKRGSRPRRCRNATRPNNNLYKRSPTQSRRSTSSTNG